MSWSTDRSYESVGQSNTMPKHLDDQRIEIEPRGIRNDSRPLILFQVPNQVGLGHINRMACVALALRNIDRSVKSLFIVEGSPHGLLDTFSLPYLTLPVSEAVNTSAAWTPWPRLARNTVVEAIASTILQVTAPNLVVYDCFPSIHFAKAVLSANIQSVLCIRKVKDFNSYASDPRVRLVLDSAREILVPHHEDEFSLAIALNAPVSYVGSVVKPLPVNPEPVQLRFNLPGRRVIVISGGGGGYRGTKDYFNLCLRAYALVKEQECDVAALLVTGPLFTEWQGLELVSDLRIIPFDPRFSDTCATADLVICQAGYNSINELTVLGSPAICVPANRGFDDQFDRAHAVARANPQFDCFEQNSPEELAKLIVRRLRQSSKRLRLEVPDGANRAAVRLLRLLNHR